MKIKATINTKDLTFVRRNKANWDDSGKSREVYKVKLNDLHYNEENGRIATWISMYTSDPSNKPLSTLEREEYNKIIEGYIKKANSKESFEILKTDIKKKGQYNPGVILDDGTIVSGNRRFTALRSLYKEDCDDKYGYFECFVLPYPSNDNEIEEIKLIETKTQFGVVREEDYNAIDRLVTIYKYLIDEKTKIWDVDEYAKKINIKPNDAEKLYIEAYLMVDYLKYIKKPLQFHIARLQKIDGPLVELIQLYKTLKRQDNIAEWKRIRPLFYSEINRGTGDKTRVVRKFKNMYSDNKLEFENLLSQLQDKQEKYEEKMMQKREKQETSEIKTPKPEIDEKEKSVSTIISLDSNVVNSAFAEVNKDNARRKPIKKVESAISSILDVDPEVVPHMDNKDKRELENKLNKLSNLIQKIYNKLSK